MDERSIRIRKQQDRQQIKALEINGGKVTRGHGRYKVKTMVMAKGSRDKGAKGEV